MWMMVFTGNFFAADCSYVRKLIPPKDFDDKMSALLTLRREKLAENPNYKYLFPNISRFDYHGTGRYGALHWVGSHPSMVPCDLTDDLAKWWGKFSWSLFPRPSPSRLDPIREHQYNYVGGNLFKWFGLYNEGPPDDSWARRWFPDGQKWKHAVARYGNQTVDIVVASKTKRTEKTGYAPPLGTRGLPRLHERRRLSGFGEHLLSTG
jgi:hypothetical protein